MDNPGWRANRRAAHEDEQYEHPRRAADGRFTPVEHANPLPPDFVGGFRPPGAAAPQVPMGGQAGAGTGPTDEHGQYSVDTAVRPRISLSSPTTAAERARLQKHQAPAQMNPHLQVMCGPLLRYDTVDPNGTYRGACMIVTADAGSVYEPHPNMSLEWDWNAPRSHKTVGDMTRTGGSSRIIPPKETELSSYLPSVITPVGYPSEDNGNTTSSSRAQKEVIPGQEIWVYNDGTTTCTFWRFIFEIPLSDIEMVVRYRINQGPGLEFFVPARHQNFRWAAHSCNGFSAGVNPDDFKGPGFLSGYDPVWLDLLAKHNETPFHILMGGGDQLYCDVIMREPEMQEWLLTKNTTVKKEYQMTKELRGAIDRFYFNHYCLAFRRGAFARANCSIPMVNMLDDHDIIDGFGSYPADLQTSPMFSTIGSRGYFFYLLFQCFIEPSLDGTDRRPYSHTFRSTILGGPGPWIPYPSHSVLTYLGPKVYMLLLDCRAERKKEQVCSEAEYQAIMEHLYRLPESAEHLVIQTGIPIAYPRMNFLESALESKLNPLVAIGKTGSLLSSMVNKFNADAELLDDLNDHWTAKGHKKERNWFIEIVQQFAKVKRMRVTFLSGDVHCAAVGVFKTLARGKEPPLNPALDHRYMLNVVSSAIVNTPPPNGVLSMVAILSDKKHRTMHYCDTDETMIPLFEKDPNGSASKSKYIMGRRNWCQVDWDPKTGDLVFSIQVEREKGMGQTVGYDIRTPPPRWHD